MRSVGVLHERCVQRLDTGELAGPEIRRPLRAIGARLVRAVADDNEGARADSPGEPSLCFGRLLGLGGRGEPGDHQVDLTVTDVVPVVDRRQRPGQHRGRENQVLGSEVCA